MEKDFIRFLSDIKYANHTANVYLWKLKKFADENGYKNLFELADDVFILLDKGTHGDRKFDTDTLSEIKKHENVLILFNCFLFDIGFKRRFVVPVPSSANYMQVLTTNQKYVPCVCPRTVHDDKDENRPRFTFTEVYLTLHISDRTLRYWAENGKRPRQHRDKYGKIYYTKDELNDFLREWFEKKDSKTRSVFMKP